MTLIGGTLKQRLLVVENSHLCEETFLDCSKHLHLQVVLRLFEAHIDAQSAVAVPVRCAAGRWGSVWHLTEG